MALVVAHVRPRAARQQELDQRRLRGPVLLSFRVAVVGQLQGADERRVAVLVRKVDVDQPHLEQIVDLVEVAFLGGVESPA